MIRNSFIFLKGISENNERNLWNNNIKDWNDFLKCKKIKGISCKTKLRHNHDIETARTAFLNDNLSYFYYHLPLKEHWRLYDSYKNEAIFIDIEASTVHDGYITCISIYDGYDIKTFVRGINFNESKIIEILKQAKLIITFNGNTFDIPFLKKKFRTMNLEVPCWDLRHSCKKLGLNGGLKEIERDLEIKRANPIVERLTGGDAIELWRTFHATGDDYFLNILVEYNQEDTINLKLIADKIYPLLIKKILEKKS